MMLKEALINFLGWSVGWLINPIARRMLRNMHTYLEIAREVEVTPDWKEYRPTRPMTFDRRCQEVFIRIADCRMRDDEHKLILPDGTKVSPELRLIDEFGNSYELESGSYGVSDPVDIENGSYEWSVSRAGYRAKLPQDREYGSIQIRSDKPVRVDEIVWHNYNLK